MSMNGLGCYSYNPYGCYNQVPQNVTNFQGTNQAPEEKESNTLKTVAAVGAGIAAVGTTIYAFTKGKAINGADGTLFKNLKTGFIEIGQTIAKKVTQLVGKNKNNVQTLSDSAKDTINAASKISAQDADLVAKYGSNMSMVGYFHKLY